MSFFKELSEVNISKYVVQKNNYDYLPWAIAWRELKTKFPQSQVKVYENKDGLPYFKSESGYFVKVGVVIGHTPEDAIEHIAYLPVLDYKNQPLKEASVFEINKSIQRCLAKAIALHGLGLSLYAREDLGGVKAHGDKPKTPPNFARYDLTTLKDLVKHKGITPDDMGDIIFRTLGVNKKSKEMLPEELERVIKAVRMLK